MTISVDVQPPIVRCHVCELVLAMAFAAWHPKRDKHGATVALVPCCKDHVP